MKTVVVIVLALVIACAASAAPKGEKCYRLHPKAGGTLVHGVFVPLEDGEFLKLCMG